MRTASTHRLVAIGTLCRRPWALLVPLAPLVLLVFIGMLLVSSARASLARPLTASHTGTTPASAPEAVSQPAPRGFQPVRTVGVAAAMLGAVLLAASAAGGTYAFLNSRQTISGVTVTSGSLSMTVEASGAAAGPTTAIPTAAWNNMLPGDFAGQTVTLANTGTVDTVVTAQLAGTPAWNIRISLGACPSTLLTSAPLTTGASAVTTIAAAANSVICVQASLPTTADAATENTASGLNITFNAEQATS